MLDYCTCSLSMIRWLLERETTHRLLSTLHSFRVQNKSEIPFYYFMEKLGSGNTWLGPLTY